MSTHRLNVTIPDDVSDILKTKKNKSKFLTEAVREKVINDKKKEIVEKARKLKKYYEIDEDLTSLNSMDSEDFVN
ncbi:hypothetical protein [Cuniculiplasma divulgatum]|uniref:MazE antitoxin n=1 Tax=Cuniculiplasma divulgatum TaxID=1673428 RepID=A0A1N5STR4_9ARCH|nr:hypothetical protein [Cuniculiplasma divulgatum]EQB69149.1 MAG: hypothetical protein AMDU5_GPLC00004G0119 [Thermoplasmatales archaeon Gpl]OWP54911.1 MAG: hypothetical protein B2I18_06800 [Cuniculiplasma sp. C_DKE]SIM39463.1 MazE antitoxin [Cuniculiplasma divulgatum]SJK84204.1 MazE antitoxin [Cuniculiplasma divulgatum]